MLFFLFEYSWNPNYSVIALGTDLSECVTDELLSRDNDNQTFVCTSLQREIIQRISKHTCQTFLMNLNVCLRNVDRLTTKLECGYILALVWVYTMRLKS